MSVDNIKVSIKIRPLIAREQNDDVTKEWFVDERGQLKSVSRGHVFSFDHIFDENTTNLQVFEQIAKPIISNALNGINGTIFAYGQTSSGKTYCMSGTEEEPGIVPLTVNEVFEQINSTVEDREFLIRVGYIEIYNEKIFDLLDVSKPEVVRIFEPMQGEVKISQVEVMASSADVMLEHFNKGNDTKRTGETAMNERSSRSHAIFSITIESRDRGSTDGECRVSTLNLVDLAGSERADQTKATGERLNESKHINQSLLALGKVIRELSANSTDSGQFISYRDSKLTRLLSASLGGNAKTAIICTITPATIDETLSTLNFANNAKNIKNKPKVNNVLSEKAIMIRLKKEIKLLKNQLKEEKSRNAELESIKQLKFQIQERESQIIHCNGSNLLKIKDMNRRRTWMCPSTNEEQVSPEISPHLLLPDTTPVQAPPFILRNTENGPMITFSGDDEHTEEIFKPSTDFDFNESLANLIEMGTDEELARRLHTPRAFKKCITLPDSPEIKLPSGTSKDDIIEKLKLENNYLREELRELEEFKKIENFCENYTHRNNQENSINLNEQQKKIAYLESMIYEKDTEISTLKELETKIQLLDNERKNAIKELHDKENILASIQYEFDQYKVKTKLREDELIHELNESRNTKPLKDKIEFLEECLRKTEKDLLNSQPKVLSEEKETQSNEFKQKIKDLENKLENEKKNLMKVEDNLKEFEATSDQLMDALQENEKLNKEINDIKNILSEKELRIQGLQNEHDNIETRLKNIQEILQNNLGTQEKNDDMNNVIMKLIQSANKTESLEIEKHQLIKEIEEIRNTAMELTDKLIANQTLTEVESNHRDKIECLRDQLEQCTFKIQDYEDKINNLQLRLEEASKNNEILYISKSQLQSEFDTKINIIQNLNDQILLLEKNQRELNEKLKISDMDLQMKQKEISNFILENDGATRQREIELSEKELISDNKIIELTDQLDKMQTFAETLIKEKQDLIFQCKKIESELEISKETISILQDKLNEMENRIGILEKSDKQTYFNSDEENQKTHDLHDIQSKHNCVLASKNELEKTMNELREKCILLSAELEITVQKLKITEDMLEVSHEKMSSLEKVCAQKLEAIQASLDSERMIKCDLQKAVTELSEKCIFLNKEVEEKEQQIKSCNQKIQQLETTNAILLDDVESITVMKSSIASELKSIKISNATRESDLQAKLEKFSSEVNENLKKLNVYEKEIQDLTVKNNNLLMVIDQKNALINDLELNLEQSANKFKCLENEIKSKTAECDEIKSIYRRRSQENGGKIQALELANNKLLQDVGAAEAVKISIENELKKLQEEHSNILKERNQFSDECSKVKASNRQHELEYNKLKIDIDRYICECEELKNNIKIANESLVQQTSENFTHLQTIAELKIINEKLNSELDLLKRQSKKNSPTQNRRSGEMIENEAFALQRKQLQIESNHGTPIRAKKSNIDRKTRRQSVYAENRRLSDWELTNSIETQTDNFDENCACREYAEKIRLLDIEVRKKQVIINNAERMAKCNPLKVDLADLKIKFDREQNINKRLKQTLENFQEELATLKSQQNGPTHTINHDSRYISRIEYDKLLSEKNSIEKKLNETRRQLNLSSEKENVGVNTSFNNIHNNEEIMALNEAHNTLMKKYDMAKRLCNLRLDDLNTLRKEISVKDEKMQEKDLELKKINNKYQEAKRICLIRMEKITALRKRLGEAGEDLDEQILNNNQENS